MGARRMSTHRLGWIPLLSLTMLTCCGTVHRHEGASRRTVPQEAWEERTVTAERTYGISRVANLEKLPKIECIRRVLGNSEGIRSVDDLYPTSLGGKLWSFQYEGD